VFDLGSRYPLYAMEADEVDLEGADPRAHAMNNVKAFIRDLEVGPFEGLHSMSSIHSLTAQRQRGGLRFPFTLRGQFSASGKSYVEGLEWSYDLSMPGVHISRVRYVGADQDPADYMRLRINGVALLWLDAAHHIHQGAKNE